MKKLVLAIFLLVSYINQAKATPAMQPKDQPIKVITNSGESLCYTPSFSGGEGYIYLDYCNKKEAQKARYDIFGRISFNVNGNALCISAPESVTSKEASQSWDYLHLRPCVINDENQKWIIDNGFIYTKDKRFRIKDHKFYAYISKNDSDKADHKLDKSMNEWVKTIAKPASISIKTPLFWLFSSPSSFRPYFITENKSTSQDFINLYLNTQNGHIARYDASNGGLRCLGSNLNNNGDWDWASWSECTDSISKDADKTNALSFDIGTENDHIIRDYWGNVLRVTRYGANWGVPYFVSPSYLEKDSKNSPTSTFVMSDKVREFSNINNKSMLALNCPINSKKRSKRGLSEDFYLNDAWLGRLWQISTSTSDYHQGSAGLCGVCMLQSVQMVQELLASPNPQNGGGYYFDTAPAQNPFDSFTARYPDLTQRLNWVLSYLGGLGFSTSDEFIARFVPTLLSSVAILMPNHSINPTQMLRNDGVRSLTSQLFNAPYGSVWLAFMYRTTPNGASLGHVEPLIVTRDGIVLLPTNENLSFEEFRDQTLPRQTINQILNRYTLNGALNIDLLMFVRIDAMQENPLSLIIAPNNCNQTRQNSHGTTINPDSLELCNNSRCM